MGFLIIKNFFALKNTLYIKKMEEKRSDNKRKYKELVRVLKEALSKILKKYRHRAYKSRKKLLKEIEDHPVIGKIVKDYKNLIFSKVIKSMMTPAEVRYYSNLEDLLDFRFRRPTMMEQKMIGDYVLPSWLFDSPLPAEADIELYKDTTLKGRLDMQG